MYIPKYAATIQIINDEKTYKIHKKNLFDWTNSTASYEKAEKVVKDPSNPMIKKYFMKFSEKFLW